MTSRSHDDRIFGSKQITANANGVSEDDVVTVSALFLSFETFPLYLQLI